MKVINMEGVVLVVGRGGLTVALGENETMILRMMQLMNAEDESDISLYEMGDEEDMNDGW